MRIYGRTRMLQEQPGFQGPVVCLRCLFHEVKGLLSVQDRLWYISLTTACPPHPRRCLLLHYHRHLTAVCSAVAVAQHAPCESFNSSVPNRGVPVRPVQVAVHHKCERPCPSNPEALPARVHQFALPVALTASAQRNRRCNAEKVPKLWCQDY